MQDALQGWVPVQRISGQCTFCAWKVTEGCYLNAHAMAACEYGQPWFPHATKCARYEPEDAEQ